MGLYRTKSIEIKGALLQIESVLDKISVQGDSVLHMYGARTMLKEMYSDISEIEVDEEGKIKSETVDIFHDDHD